VTGETGTEANEVVGAASLVDSNKPTVGNSPNQTFHSVRSNKQQQQQQQQDRTSASGEKTQ